MSAPYPHPIWTRLRREDPVSWQEQAEGIPYWAITKHDDITAISNNAGVDDFGLGRLARLAAATRVVRFV